MRVKTTELSRLFSAVPALFACAACGQGAGGIPEEDSDTPALGQIDNAVSSGCEPSDPNVGLFDHAVCVCEDIRDIGNGLTTETWAAFVGIGPSTHQAHAAVNGGVESIGNLSIDGRMDIGGRFNAIGNVDVKGDLLVANSLNNAGRVVVLGNASVGKHMTGAGYFKTDKTLTVSGELFYLGAISYGALIRHAPFPTHTPCPCGKGDIIDVAGIVSQHRQAIPIVLPSGMGNNEMTLSSGDYYSNDGTLFVGNVVLRIHGYVRLFIEGDIETIGNRVISLEDGGQMDLYVAGSLHTIGNIVAGAPRENGPSGAIRVYLGGSDRVSIAVVGNEIFNGGLYAPKADVRFVGNSIVHGAIRARSIHGSGNLMVLYNPEIVGGDCPQAM